MSCLPGNEEFEFVMKAIIVVWWIKTTNIFNYVHWIESLDVVCWWIEEELKEEIWDVLIIMGVYA